MLDTSLNIKCLLKKSSSVNLVSMRESKRSEEVLYKVFEHSEACFLLILPYYIEFPCIACFKLARVQHVTCNFRLGCENGALCTIILIAPSDGPLSLCARIKTA